MHSFVPSTPGHVVLLTSSPGEMWETCRDVDDAELYHLVRVGSSAFEYGVVDSWRLAPGHAEDDLKQVTVDRIKKWEARQ